jgi:N-acetylglucosamine kinase-like BadF-type ATPase
MTERTTSNPTTAPIILGVDGGNSKTLAAVADATGQVHGVGRSSGGNHQNKGLGPAMEQIALACDAALSRAGLQRRDVEVAYYSLAGADLDDDFALLNPALAELAMGRRYALANDTVAGLRAGARRGDCVVVIVGSGTNAAGRNAEGTTIHLPGLGWLSGDWGGGGDLAREAVSLAAREWDGRGRPTALTKLVLEMLDVPTMDAAILAVYQGRMQPGRFLDLVPQIFEVAVAGDAVARELVERQAEEVVTTAGALIRRLGLTDRPCDVVLAGSVFRDRTGLLVAEVRARLAERYPQAEAIVSELEPVLGAVLCGFDLLGLETGQPVRERLFSSYAAMRAEGTQVVTS